MKSTIVMALVVAVATTSAPATTHAQDVRKKTREQTRKGRHQWCYGRGWAAAHVPRCYSTETLEGPLGKPIARKIYTPCEGFVSVSGYPNAWFAA